VCQHDRKHEGVHRGIKNVLIEVQVIENKAIADRNYQMLLGTDNLQHLGARVGLAEGHTEYTKVPDIQCTWNPIRDEGLQRSARVLGLCRSAGISQPAVE
jgi:hypothetical protein